MKKIDGRKARWFDCDWNNTSRVQDACGKCKVCKYLEFLDSGATIQYNKTIDDYVALKTFEEKQLLLEIIL